MADFNGYYESQFNYRPNRNLTPDPPGFWDAVHAHGTFFESLPLMPDAIVLWDGLTQRGFEPIILTGIPKSVPGVEAQKRAWVAKHLGPDVKVITCFSREKATHGQPGDILIDDWKRYQKIWTKMGGIFILHRFAAASLAEVPMTAADVRPEAGHRGCNTKGGSHQ